MKITATISTKNRTETTLPLCLTSIANQTFVPDNLLIFDDNDAPVDLRQKPLYQHIFNLLDIKKIKWQVIYGQRKGQIYNHQMALDIVKDDCIWRLDDDDVPEPNVLEVLVSNMADEKVGAVAGLVLTPGQLSPLPTLVADKIEDILCAPNRQWFLFKDKAEVDHLHSTFLFRREAASHGYCMEISRLGSREESLMSYEMKRKGWKLIVDPSAVTWHFCHGKTSAERSQMDRSLWENDENVFLRKLKEWGVQLSKNKLIVQNNGLGDHLAFLNILPEIRKKFPDHRLILGACYPEVFRNEKDLTIISIAEANSICGNMGISPDSFDIYKYCADRNWQKPLIDSFREMYL